MSNRELSALYKSANGGCNSSRKRPADSDEEPYYPPRRPSPAAPVQPRKVLAPGATQEALARLAEHQEAMKARAASLPPSPATVAAVLDPSPPFLSSTTAVASQRVPAPGATKAALASLANQGSSSNLPASAAAGGSMPRQQSPGISQKVCAPGATQEALQRLKSLKSTYSSQLNSSSSRTVGANVWAKLPSFPWWPGQVQRPSPEQNRLKHCATDIFVVFYGTADFAWVPLSDVKEFNAALPEYSKYASSKNKSLQRAIDEAWRYLGQARPDVNGKVFDF